LSGMDRRTLKVADLVTSRLQRGNPNYILGIVVRELGGSGFIAVQWRDGKIRYHLRSALKWLS
jgi:hypothetical protein